MNILKKTFILFCLAAVSLDTVQPIGVAAANKASRKNRKEKPKKGSQGVIIGACITFVGLIFFYKYNSSGATNDESPTPTQNSNQPDASTSGTGKPSNQVSNPGVSPTNKPLNGSSNKPDASTSGTGTSSNQDQANASSPSPPSPPQQQEILVARDPYGYAYLIDEHNNRMLKFGKETREVKLSPDGNKILTVDDKNVKLYTFNSTKSDIEQKEIEQLAGLQKPIVWNPKNENEFIAAQNKKAGQNKQIVWFDIQGNTNKEIDTEQKDRIDHLNFSPDGRYILGTTMTRQSQIFIYDTKKEKLIYNQKYDSYVNDIQWDSKQEYIAIAGDDKKVQIYKFTTPQKQDDIALQKVHETKRDRAVFSVSWSPDDAHLAFNTNQNLYIATWNPPKNDTKPSLECKVLYSKNTNDHLETIAWSSDGKKLAFSQGKTIFVYQNPIPINSQDKVKKEKKLLSSFLCHYLAYGFVKDTSKWPAAKFIKDSAI